MAPRPRKTEPLKPAVPIDVVLQRLQDSAKQLRSDAHTDREDIIASVCELIVEAFTTPEKESN